MPQDTSVACRFCQIIGGQIKSCVVYEDETSLAFLDHRPLFPGHCLLVPKRHYETIIDLPPDTIAPLFAAARLLAQAVQEAMAAEGSFLGINNRVSQSVPHLHIHIVPRRKGDGLRGFFWPRQPYKNDSDILQVQAAVRAAVARIAPPAAQ